MLKALRLVPFLAAVAIIVGVGALLGVRLAGHRAAGVAASPVAADPVLEARRSAGKSVRAAVASLALGDTEAAIERLREAEGYTPGNGYVAMLRMAVALRKADPEGAASALDAAVESPHWDLYTDALDLPHRSQLDNELEVIREAVGALCLGLADSSIPGGSEALRRVRDLGLALASAMPRDFVHLQAGAHVRRRATQELLALARRRGRDDIAKVLEEQEAADAAWQEAVNSRLIAFLAEQADLAAASVTDLLNAEGHEVTELLRLAPP